MSRLLLILTLFSTSMIVTDFNTPAEIQKWYAVNDTVMGGESSCNFQMNDDGYARFSGQVSTANNGGFSSIRYNPGVFEIGNSKTAMIKLKGDGKNYQFRLKKNQEDYYSYIYEFETTGEWQTVEIPLDEMYASWRGRKVGVPNFDANQITEVAILIGNKKNEKFELLLDQLSFE